MKALTLGFVTLLSLSASATTLKEIFGPLQGKPACFGKTYSEGHLKRHPKQTVKNILVKLRIEPQGKTPLFEVLVNQKNAPKKNLRQSMVCFENDGKVACAVDCDGGSVSIEGLEEGMLTVKSNGFTLVGGCGEEVPEAETVYLHNKAGGDDYFVLNELPLVACAKVPFPAN